MGRGEIKPAVMEALADGPGHGYDVMQRLEERSAGAWRPSPGSVYPTLQLLEDEGLAVSVERDGKRIYELTDAGHAAVVERRANPDTPPWAFGGRGAKEFGELRLCIGQVALAARQVAMSRSIDKVEQAVTVLKTARKQLYTLLAED
jgi:DNA-binding PadR family transcriptional regulator